MTRKRYFMLALACASSLIFSVPASAYTEYTSIGTTEYRNSDGCIEAVNHYRCNGILIETDGTSLTEDMLQDMEGYAGLAAWETPIVSAACWVEVSEEPGEHAYMVYLEGNDPLQYEMIGRRIMLAYDFVEKASIVEFVSYNTTCFWLEHKLIVNAVNEDIVLDESTIPEFAGLSFSGGSGSAVYSLEGAEDCQIIRDLEGKSEGEKFEYMRTLAEEIEVKYSDIVASTSQPVIMASSTPDSSELSAVSIWNSAGDLDADGEINASDAAELLVLSAMKGATADGSGYDPFTTVQKSAADLNGDTFCDANDAAYILQFAAEAGAGSELSIGEFMTRE